MYQAGFGGTNWLKLTGPPTGCQAHLLKRGCKGNKKWEKSRHFGSEGKSWGEGGLALFFSD